MPGSTANRCCAPRAAIGFALAAHSSTRSPGRVRTIPAPGSRERVPLDAVVVGKHLLCREYECWYLFDACA